MRNTPRQAPIVSFSRGGEDLELGRGLSLVESHVHMYGSTGLGLAPVEIAANARLGGHGSILRGVRYGVRDVFIPLFAEGVDLPDLNVKRAELYALLAPDLGPVDITVTDPATGAPRTIQGVLKDGLTGDFGNDYHGYWQKLGLTFECHDPWWHGPEKIHTFQVGVGVKPFTSQTVPFFPVVITESSVRGEVEVTVHGDGPVWPTWQIFGPGSDLVLSKEDRVFRVNGNIDRLVLDWGKGSMSPDRWKDVPAEDQPWQLTPGTNRALVTLVGADRDSRVSLIYRERFRAAI